MTRSDEEGKDFFMAALKEEARTAIWQVGSNADPSSLISSILEDLEALAPREDGQDNRSDEQIWNQIRERLIKAAYATRPYCIRCGKCCSTGSPTLLLEDLDLFRKDVLKPSEVFTIRKGELVYYAPVERLSESDNELIKIKEVPGSKTCIFFQPSDKSCSIYEDRPMQCRRQECWNSLGPDEVLSGTVLQREALLVETGPLWQIIQRHEEKCSFAELQRIMAKLGATKGHTVEELLELLQFDHHVREFLAERFDLASDTLDFFLGRSLNYAMGIYGLQVTEQPDGSFLLTSSDQADDQ